MWWKVLLAVLAVVLEYVRQKAGAGGSGDPPAPA